LIVALATMGASRARPLRALRPPVALGLFIAVSAVSVVLVKEMGYWSLLVPTYMAFGLLAILKPRLSTLVLVFLGIAVEPGAIDYTRPLAYALWEAPPALKPVLPLTMSPVEIFLCLTAASFLFVKTRGIAPKLPALVYAAPLVLFAGIAYGLSQGGDSTLAYHEARGLLYAMVAFFVARKVAREPDPRIKPVAIAASLTLAVIVLIRYELFVKTGRSTVPVEFAFAHEDAIFLGLGFVMGLCFIVKANSGRERALLVLHNLIVLAAILSTGRRSGTLVLVVGMAFLYVFLIPRKPGMMLLITGPLILCVGAYLGAFWNKEYGALAQPARAVRSQIDPSERDKSSDEYRDHERLNVLWTLQGNQPFGVGFGRPFGQYIPLADLSGHWPLQQFTPHQNLMWLWLKMGIVGISVFLGVWVLAFRQCLRAIRDVIRGRSVDVLPVIVAAGLMMYVTYAKVDLALIGTRSAGPLAALVAIALTMNVGPAIAAQPVPGFGGRLRRQRGAALPGRDASSPPGREALR
jgi:O-Antigen ligase